jgi:hypothetical protein
LVKPGLAQFDQSFGFQHALRQGKHNPLFAVEMTPGMGHSSQQKTLSLFQPHGAPDQLQAFIHFLVFLQEGVALADLLETMFQRTQEQPVFSIGMGFEHHFQQGRQRFDFADRFETDRDTLDVIEHVMEHQVFSQQRFRNLHARTVC